MSCFITFAQAYQRNKIQELEPLRSQLRLVTEECDNKIHARWAQEHCEMAAIKKEKEQLHKELEALKEREKATHAVVNVYNIKINLHLLDQRVLLLEGNFEMSETSDDLFSLSLSF